MPLQATVPVGGTGAFGHSHSVHYIHPLAWASIDRTYRGRPALEGLKGLGEHDG